MLKRLSLPVVCLTIGLALGLVLVSGLVQSRGAQANTIDTMPVGPDLSALGWEMLEFDGIMPSMFAGTADGIIEVRSDRGSSVLYRQVADDPVLAQRLTWDWRVIEGLPATNLRQTDGDDRVLAVHVVFAEDDMMSRIKGAFNPFARGRVITYVWGDDEKAEFPHPHLPDQGFMIIRKTSDDPMREWFTETIDLKADYERAFGRVLPPVAYVAISGDADDLNAVSHGQIRNIRFY